MIIQFEPVMSDFYADVVRQQVVSGWIGCGDKVKKLEEKFCELTGAKYSNATTSGTSSLLIAMKIANMFTGKNKFIISDYSFPSSINICRFMGYDYKLIDVNKKTMCMNIQDVIKNIDKETAAVVFVNHNGYVGKDLEWLSSYCKQYGVILIEDSACALGQIYNGKHAGTFGHIGCFSFSVPKIVTTGQGGMIITNDELVDKYCKEIIDQGSTEWRKTGIHDGIGLNFKFNDILASLALAQINVLFDLFDKRIKIYDRYMKNGIRLIYFDTDKHVGPWFMVHICKKSRELMEYLSNNGIQSKMLYRPSHQFVSIDDNEYPVTTSVWNEALYLPSHLNLTNDNIDYICDIIKQFKIKIGSDKIDTSSIDMW